MMVTITMEKLFAFEIMKESEEKLKKETAEDEKIKLQQKICFCRQVVAGQVNVPLDTLEELLLP